MSLYTKFVEASVHQQMIYLFSSRMVAIAAWMAGRWREPPSEEEGPDIHRALTGMRQELVSMDKLPAMPYSPEHQLACQWFIGRTIAAGQAADVPPCVHQLAKSLSPAVATTAALEGLKAFNASRLSLPLGPEVPVFEYRHQWWSTPGAGAGPGALMRHAAGWPGALRVHAD